MSTHSGPVFASATSLLHYGIGIFTHIFFHTSIPLCPDCFVVSFIVWKLLKRTRFANHAATVSHEVYNNEHGIQIHFPLALFKKLKGSNDFDRENWSCSTNRSCEDCNIYDNNRCVYDFKVLWFMLIWCTIGIYTYFFNTHTYTFMCECW